MMQGHIIDLSQGVRTALRLLRANPLLCHQVKSLTIERPGDFPGYFTEEDLHRLFSIVGYLPQLQTLTVDFDELFLPVTALTVMLQGARGLLELGLFHLSLTGSAKDFEDLERTLQEQECLENVRLVHCKRHNSDDDDEYDPYGNNFSSYEKEIFTDINNNAPAARQQIKRIPQMFCHSKNLRRLWLQDCPGDHIVAVAQAIQERDSHVKELSIVSSNVSDLGVESLSEMLHAKTMLEELRIAMFRSHALRVAEAVDADCALKKLTCDILVPLSKPSLLTDGPKLI